MDMIVIIFGANIRKDIKKRKTCYRTMGYPKYLAPPLSSTERKQWFTVGNVQIFDQRSPGRDSTKQ